MQSSYQLRCRGTTLRAKLGLPLGGRAYLLVVTAEHDTKPHYARPDSVLQRLMLETKYVRILGRKLYATYETTISPDTRMTVRVSGGDAWIVNEIFGERPYEKYFRPGEGAIVLDVGAHIGCFTLRSAHLVGDAGKVIAVEPFSGNFSLLGRNLKMNRFSNVQALRLALGEGNGDVELTIFPHFTRNSIMRRDNRERPLGTERVELKSLDALVGSLGISRLDFIKLDAEGAELKILRGGLKTLNAFHPDLVGEAHPQFSDSAELITAFLAGLGYNCKVESYGDRTELFYASLRDCFSA